MLALPPISFELLNEQLENGPLIVSSIAQFVYKKKIEPAGEAFFFKFEGREWRKAYTTECSFPLNNEKHIISEGNTKENKRKVKRSSNKANNNIPVSLARLKQLVGETETLYQKLGVTESAGPNEIKKAYRKLALFHHPDKNSESSSDMRSDEFLKIQEAYEILSDANLRHAYDSALPFDESIPNYYSTEDECFQNFKNFFSPIFIRNSRWSVNKPVPDLGNEDDEIRTVEEFYNFWRGFESNRDFSIHDEYELSQAECREEKRWMERQNSKIRSKYIRNEISRINKLVELAYKHDPRIKLHYRNIDKIKEEKKMKKKEEKETIEREKRLLEEQTKKKASEYKAIIRSQRISVRNIMKELSDIELLINEFQREAYFLSDGIEIVSEFSSWNNEFLNEILLRYSGYTDGEYLISKLEVKQWEDWLLKLNLAQLQELNDFLNNWKEKNGQMSNDKKYLKKLFIIYNLKISSVVKTELKKSKTDEISNLPNETQVKILNTSESDSKQSEHKESNNSEWSIFELSLLAKALQKYPGGVKNRWNLIYDHLKGTKTKEQILTKVKELSESEKLAKLSNEVKEESPFEIFIQSNKGVLKKFDNAPDIRDCPEKLESNQDKMQRKTEENDLWTKEQQNTFESALKKYPASIPSKERWELISSCVQGKNTIQCIARFKFIREQIMKNKSKT
ncbi:hypothetical protein FG379_002339 [Cryptosporidium bovis]|uniref:uncharacterized protein n=1 Tax=Cryptosporidium bovis TaxID=310047 RepID=UPI00351A9A09|nr:hypothetical protein FG379_002339 [Cryptosporidium bovis]